MMDARPAGRHSHQGPPRIRPGGRPGSVLQTQVYIDLAGETFREEAERLEERIFAGTSAKNRYKVEAPLPVE
jgi:hypothetical protein